MTLVRCLVGALLVFEAAAAAVHTKNVFYCQDMSFRGADQRIFRLEVDGPFQGLKTSVSKTVPETFELSEFVELEYEDWRGDLQAYEDPKNPLCEDVTDVCFKSKSSRPEKGMEKAYISFREEKHDPGKVDLDKTDVFFEFWPYTVGSYSLSCQNY